MRRRWQWLGFVVAACSSSPVPDVDDDVPPPPVCTTDDVQPRCASSIDVTGDAGLANVLAVGDLNADGVPDLVVDDPYGPLVRIGRGDGTFLPGAETGSGVDWHGPLLAILDANRDGIDDIVSVRENATGVPVFRVSTAGPFAPPTFQMPLDGLAEIGSLAQVYVAVGDFNADGASDLALTVSDRLGVLLGAGDGSFSARWLSDVTPWFSSRQLIAADVDGDGDDDLITNETAPAVLRSNGDGTFDALPPMLPQGLVTLADVNVDGHIDLVIARDQQSGGIRLGNGDGTFGSEIPRRPTRLGAAADVDEDGVPDLVVPEGFGFVIEHGNGDGTFTITHRYWSIGGTPRLADFTGDGDVDILDGGMLHRGRGDGSFVAPTGYTSYATAAGDLDSDGRNDLVTGELTAARVYLSSRSLSTPAIEWELPAHVTWIRALDVDHDCNVDVAVGYGGGIGIWFGNSHGEFAEPLSLDQYGHHAEFGDINGDGYPDLVDSGIGVLRVRLNDGRRGFVGARDYAVCSRAPVSEQASFSSDIVVGDATNDGFADVLLTRMCPYPDTRAGFVGQADGSLSESFDMLVAGLAIADVDADGLADIIRADGVLFGGPGPQRQHVGFHLEDLGELNGSDAEVPYVSDAVVKDVDHDGVTEIVLSARVPSFIRARGSVLIVFEVDGRILRRTRVVHVPAAGKLLVIDADGDTLDDVLITGPKFHHGPSATGLLPTSCRADAPAPSDDVRCSTVGQCPGRDSACAYRACESDVCTVVDVAAGTPVEDYIGNCETAHCDGAGDVARQIDDTDLPYPNNPCAGGTCTNGQPAPTYEPEGLQCGSDGLVCDGAYTCMTPTLFVYFAGSASGEIRVRDASGAEVASCTGSCDVTALTLGATYTLEASTPFAGGIQSVYDASGSRPCSSPCTFVARVHNSTTVVFEDYDSIWSFVGDSGEAFTSAAYDDAGTLFVGSASRLIAFESDGSIRWSQPFPVDALAASTPDVLYALADQTLVKLDSTSGSVLWQRPAATCPNVPGPRRCIAIAPDGDVMFGGPTVMRWAPDGTLRWAVPGGAGWNYNSFAIDPEDDVAYVPVVDPTRGLIAARFSRDGASLSELVDTNPGHVNEALGFPNTTFASLPTAGLLVASWDTSGTANYADLRHYLPDGTASVTGVVLDPNSSVVVATSDETPIIGIATTSLQGTMFTHRYTTPLPTYPSYLPSPHTFAFDVTGRADVVNNNLTHHFAIAGVYQSLDGPRAFVRVLPSK